MTSTTLTLLFMFIVRNACFGEIVQMSGMFGQISSPNYPDPYPDEITKSWSISVPQGFVVNLYFRTFDVEFSDQCEYDYVNISSGKKSLGRFCGGDDVGRSSTPGDVMYTSVGNQLNLQFRSDFSNEYIYSGFAAHYRADDINECADQNGGCDHNCHNYLGGYYCSCRHGYDLHSDLSSCTVDCAGNIYTATEGTISSPDYPMNYPRQLRCDWTINVEDGYVIDLSFSDFDIEAHPDVVCPYDYLTVESGGLVNGRLCGALKPQNITTAGNLARISFHSDAVLSGRGFKAVYRAIGKPCVDIEAPIYGTIHGDEFTYKLTVRFSCNRGYILQGSEIRSCMADGNWSGEQAWCQIVDCGPPAAIHHGSWRSRSAENYTLNNFVLYSCDEFYDLSLDSESVRQCTAEGTWLPDEPICEQICGVASVQPYDRPREVQTRITGGRKAIPGSWPWQALIEINTADFTIIGGLCGGNLINEQWILTAAHCLNDTVSPRALSVLPLRSFRIHLAVHRRDEVGDGDTLEVYPDKIVVHPDFDKIEFDADIALIKLNQSVKFSRNIRPICLPEQNPTPNANNDRVVSIQHADQPSDKGVVIGWGRQGFKSESNQLLEVYVSLVSRNTCQAAYPAYPVTRGMICAGERSGGKDACKGDSGGPYMFRNDDLAYFVHGIVSWGNNCGREGYFGVYARVENYVSWIKNVTATE